MPQPDTGAFQGRLNSLRPRPSAASITTTNALVSLFETAVRRTHRGWCLLFMGPSHGRTQVIHLCVTPCTTNVRVDLRPAKPKLLILLEDELSWRRVWELRSSGVRHLPDHCTHGTHINSLLSSAIWFVTAWVVCSSDCAHRDLRFEALHSI